MTAHRCAGAPLISVVVPTFNRLLRLKRVLAALADQTVPSDRYEVIVVSDGSTDGTNEYLASAPYPIVVAVQPNAGPAAARNRGAELARAELILFVDDDVIASRDLVEQHLASHSAVGGPELVVIGPMLNPPDFKMSSWIRWEQAMLYKQYGAMERGLFKPTFRQFYTGNASLPRAALFAVGGFDTEYRRAEDVELAFRLAANECVFAFNPEAIGHHYAERSFGSWAKNAYDYGVNDVLLSRIENREWLLVLASWDFGRRHRFTRWTAKTCVDHRWLAAAAKPPLRAIAAIAGRVGVEKVARASLSGIYGIEYYRGLADTLGGPDAFNEAIVLPSQSER